MDSKLHGPDLLSCPYAMYRGLTQALLASKDKYVRKQQIGILGGNNDLVLDVILGTDVTTTLDTPELNSRWDSLEYQPMGLVLFADGDDNSPLQHVATVREVFARVQKPVLLIVFGKFIEPMTWMFNDHDESEKFIRVEIDSKGKIVARMLTIVSFQLTSSGLRLMTKQRSWCHKLFATSLGK